MKRLVLFAVASVVFAAGSTRAEEPSPATPPTFDRVAARTSLLRRLHHQADEAAGLAHLAARVAANEAFPLSYLGIDADPDPAAGGMRVTRVYPLTTAESAKLKEQDVILAVDGAPTATIAALGLAIRSREAGTRIELRYRRGSDERTERVVLSQRPEDNDEEEEAIPLHGPAEHGAAASVHLTFDDATSDGLPATLDALLGGHGAPARWQVVREPGAVFLRQTADDVTGIRYPMAWAAELHARDVHARVRFRLVGGRQDRAAGLVVRGQDRWTYLVARVNGAENDLCLFRCAHGRRKLLPGGRAQITIKDGDWHVLEVKAQGPRITATLDGTLKVTSYDTYVRGWHAGLWTKSDSVTDFDDFTATGLPPEGER